jgi:uncharacterized membrane protein YbhN (UPF0104 family)
MSGVFLCCLQAVTRRPFSWAEVLWTIPMISAISAVPITFAGVGVREGAALTLLSLYGIPAGDAVVASLLVFVTYFLWASSSGLFLWYTDRRFSSASDRETAEKDPTGITDGSPPALPQQVDQ